MVSQPWEYSMMLQVCRVENWSQKHKQVGGSDPRPKCCASNARYFYSVVWNVSLGNKREWYPGYLFSSGLYLLHKEIDKGCVLAVLAPKIGLLWSLEVYVGFFYFSEEIADQVSCSSSPAASQWSQSQDLRLFLSFLCMLNALENVPSVWSSFCLNIRNGKLISSYL